MSKKLKHAFTLVELVVVTMLLGVITTAIVMIIRPTQRHYNNITNKAQEQNKCIPVSDIIDAELRYSTALKIVYTDKNGNIHGAGDVWSTVDSAVYPNFFHISNNHREFIGSFDARGYAEKGQTATGNTVYSMINKGYFTDFDYQFAISGINTATGQQSVTLRIEAAPMRVTPDDVTVDLERKHAFEETFKLMNLRNKGSLGGQILDMSLPADDLSDYIDPANDDYGEIYIFYAIPKDVASSGGGLPSSSHPMTGLDDEGAYDSLIPNLHINDPTEVDYCMVVFVGGPNYSSDYKIKIADSPGSQMQINGGNRINGDGQQNVPCGTQVTLHFTDNSGYVELKATNAPGGERTLDPIPLSVFSTYPIIYVYDFEIFYTDPAAIPDGAHITTVHYLYTIGESYRGVRFYNATSAPHTVQVDGSNPGFIACDRDRDIQVLVYDNESHVDAVAGTQETTATPPITIDYNSPSDIWLCEGRFYDNPNDLPERLAPIAFHYITDVYDTNHGFGLAAATANSASANGQLLTTNVSAMSGEGNFDVIVNVNPGATIKVYNASNQWLRDVSASSAQREFWIYDGSFYESMPDNVRTYDKAVRVHYIKSPDDNDYGLRIYDNDAIAQSSMMDAIYIPDRSGSEPGYYDGSQYKSVNPANTDFTITLKHPNAYVYIMGVNQWNSNGFYVTINNGSPDDIWIYNFNWYGSYEDVAPLLPENQPEPEPPQPGTLQVTEYRIESSWVIGGQVKIVFSANGGDTTAKRVRITMANPITNPQNGWGSVNGGYESVDGNTIIYRVNPMAAGSTGDLFAAFDSQDFSLVSVEIID